MEREANDPFRALERAEKGGGHSGTRERFGKAMADLNENLDHGQWMKTLERLGALQREVLISPGNLRPGPGSVPAR